MRQFNRISFLLEDFSLPSPGQQLLDRFLIGFPRDGVFQRSKWQVHAWLEKNSNAELVEQRRKDFNLTLVSKPEDALREVDAVMIVGASALGANEDLVQRTLQAVPAGTAVFVYGLPARTRERALAFHELAKSRRCQVVCGTAIPTTFRLPEISVPEGTRLRNALIVVQGEDLNAELNALEGLLPLLERRRGGESGIQRLRLLKGDDVWRAGDQEEWSWELLGAALSRSHTPQGNPIADGRTEDLVGLGLVPKLARNPRAWLLRHRDGLRSTLLVLDGVVADINWAVRTRFNRILSAQLFLPPSPQQEQFSRLAAALTDCIDTGRPPWPTARCLMETGVLEAMRKPSAKEGPWLELA